LEFEEISDRRVIPILLVLENAIIIGQYVVQLDDESIPTSIVSGADGSVLAEILGIYPLSDIDENRLAAADESCDAAAADVGDRKRRVEEKKVELSGGGEIRGGSEVGEGFGGKLREARRERFVGEVVGRRGSGRRIGGFTRAHEDLLHAPELLKG